MDVLSDILDATKLQGTLYFSTEFTPPWGIRVPEQGKLARFHLVVRGRLWVQVEGCDEAACLEPSDLVLVPHGAGHELRDAPDTPVEELDQVLEQSGFSGRGSLVHGGGDTGGATRLLCGHLSLDDHVEHPLFQRLPPMIVVRRDTGDGPCRIDELIRFISCEARDASPGHHAVVRRLSEVIFIQALRAWAARSRHDEGLLAALADPRLGKGLEQVHESPATGWTLDSLARAVGMSRTAFADRFKRVVGMPPMQYVTLWRMQRARLLLAESDQSLEQVAEEVGYESAAALSRTFKRWVGEPPGNYRKRARVIASEAAS